jgi:hypothetical protein
MNQRQEGATTAQLSYIRQLIRKAEFDPNHVTPLYRRLGVPEHWQGSRVDEYLGALSKSEASTLINKLKDAAGEEDEDDED